MIYLLGHSCSYCDTDFFPNLSLAALTNFNLVLVKASVIPSQLSLVFVDSMFNIP